MSGGGRILQRLRTTGLRPTMARIGVLQVIEAASPAAVCAEEVFRRMMLRGTRASMGTVYRVIHQLEAAGLLLREWDANRKAHYRIKPAERDVATILLVCRESGRSVVLTDGDLHARLVAAARREGLAPHGGELHAEVTCMDGGARPPHRRAAYRDGIAPEARA